MAKLTQAQKDAYIAELEAKIEEEDNIQNDQLNILNINQSKKKHEEIMQRQLNTLNINQKQKKKHKKITQRTSQAWLLVALTITLLLSIMNIGMLSMYMDLFEKVGGPQYEEFKANRG